MTSREDGIPPLSYSHQGGEGEEGEAKLGGSQHQSIPMDAADLCNPFPGLPVFFLLFSAHPQKPAALLRVLQEYSVKSIPRVVIFLMVGP